MSTASPTPLVSAPTTPTVTRPSAQDAGVRVFISGIAAGCTLGAYSAVMMGFTIAAGAALTVPFGWDFDRLSYSFAGVVLFLFYGPLVGGIFGGILGTVLGVVFGITTGLLVRRAKLDGLERHQVGVRVSTINALLAVTLACFAAGLVIATAEALDLEGLATGLVTYSGPTSLAVLTIYYATRWAIEGYPKPRNEWSPSKQESAA